MVRFVIGQLAGLFAGSFFDLNRPRQLATPQLPSYHNRHESAIFKRDGRVRDIGGTGIAASIEP
jgi:hypothetical protein